MQKNFFNFLFILYSFSIAGQSNFLQEGLASFYADTFEGRKTASGEIYTHTEYTAAHLMLPFGTLVKVTNLANEKSVIVRINDRGPFVQNRIIDLSKFAAIELDFVGSGLVNVRIEIEKEAPVENKDILAHKMEVQPLKSFLDTTQVKSNKQESHRTGVQIGSFKECENLPAISKELENTFKQPVSIKIAKVNNKNIYRVIVGNFTSMLPAEKLKEQLSPKYPDCFIVIF